MDIEIVICKSSHGTHSRKLLYEELCTADIFVPEFFCSDVINLKDSGRGDVFEKSLIPAFRIAEAYERARAENKELKVIEDKGAMALFFNKFERLDKLESEARRELYFLAFVTPLVSGFQGYKSQQKELYNKIENYAKFSVEMEDTFSDILVKKLMDVLPTIKKDKIKVVIDSGYIHQYDKLKKNITDLEKALSANVTIKERIEKETIFGFFEDMVMDVAKGRLKKDDINKYSKKIAQATLFEAIYSAHYTEIYDLGMINREKQEVIYKKYLPKVQNWGEDELKKFWEALYNNPDLKPYINPDDMEKILKIAGLD